MTKRLIFRCALPLALLVLSLELLCAFIPDRTSVSRLVLAELRARSGHIDTLLLGTSHVYSDANPEVLMAALSGEVLNFGSADQTAMDSYFLLREVLKGHTVGTLVLELNARTFAWDEPLFGNTQKLLMHMPMSRNKVEYHRASMGYPLALDALYRAALRHSDVIRGVKELALLDKLDPAYATGPVDPDRAYMGRGYMRFFEVMDRDAEIDEEMLDPEPFAMSDVQQDYLDRIAALCRDEGIELVLAVYPSHEAQIVLEQAPMQQAHDAFAAFARAQSLPLLDYNLLPPGSLPLTDALFRDIDHLNGAGSDVFSRRLAGDLLALRRGETPGGFCETYAERARLVDGLRGLGLVVEPDPAVGHVAFTAYPVTGRADLRAECRFVLTDERGRTVWDSGWCGKRARWPKCEAGRYELTGYSREVGSDRDYEAMKRMPVTLY